MFRQIFRIEVIIRITVSIPQLRRLGGSFTNFNNFLGMLGSLGFASGLSLPLGIIITLVNDWIHLWNKNNNKINIIMPRLFVC